MTFDRRTGWLLVMPAAVLTVVFFVAPLVYFLRFSFERPSRTAFSEPVFTLENFARFFASPFHVGALTRTLLVAAAATVLALLLALPVAYLITKARARTKALLIILTVFPLLVGNVVRSISWVALLGYSGVINTVLTAVGLLDAPVELLRTATTVTVAITSVVLPLMVLTLQASLESVDPNTERAALDLGARPLRVFRQIVLPQIVPGIAAGTSLVFVLCINAYATPRLVGGAQVPMLAPVVYDTISSDNNWPFGASMAALMLVVSLAVVLLYGRLLRRQFEGWRVAR
ncbi:putative spermidine/putrescine transport system permease protein [Pseudonocardia hierapolitana]|uniref:Putative spermidine/putrescine transport system permease protein n=1 Tax=Pseudonocardia hierapolitana TaxID=1128676 RepID=A0A561T0U7_9PSEU|nr:ABC transporter permease [Pseudonocardia hierapolitana]TWF80746.1 putative spermidine/putrescine transport system permease protein [Pseudonocardia hierapolitana]